ncbi:acyl-CoA thioesterase [Streptomyces dysideae]|uniref:4-hydroxybenzoyl-CoA thioesterase n=1 Tax=Streptomyces dysideae TaxID=909626 RepID=A0A101UTA1_9ACTN|nr:acyl-CoA thioesterase [Streptomyces dysideae]KUO16452.1 4-hydroxybenzoyl-CoA thioesterase [Streptomyces dysideae]
MPDHFEYRHVVGFEETNLVGNVYFTNYVSWQGRCREMFLYQHAPEVLAELQTGLKLFTVNCSCEYFLELQAFDVVSVRMRLREVLSTQVEFTFDYVHLHAKGERLAARGSQRVACMRSDGLETVPITVPESLVSALESFRAVPA